MGEAYVELMQQARKQMHLADHMVYVTYPMVQETRFLLAILHHMTNASRLALQALLEFEYIYKRIDAFNRTFAGEIRTYKEKIQGRYGMDAKYLKLLQRLMDLEKYDKNSPVRFKRGDKYILSTTEYNMSVLDLATIKRYNELAKKFVSAVSDITAKTEHVNVI